MRARCAERVKPPQRCTQSACVSALLRASSAAACTASTTVMLDSFMLIGERESLALRIERISSSCPSLRPIWPPPERLRSSSCAF